MAKTPQAAGETAPKKSKKKLMIMIGGIVLLVVAGGAGYTMLGGSSSKSTAVPKPVPGVVVPLEAITVNLAGGHYLKIQIALQLTASAGEKVDGSAALDHTITEFSNRPMADFASTEGREKAKVELVKALQEPYEKKVMDVYLTGFVIQ